MESILTSIKLLLGLPEDYEHFDPQITMHINSVFLDLNQIGVGPDRCFSIEDKTSTWIEFLGDNTDYDAAKTYLYLRVKLLFDPPASTAVIEAMNRDIARYEFRLCLAAETAES